MERIKTQVSQISVRGESFGTLEDADRFVTTEARKMNVQHRFGTQDLANFEKLSALVTDGHGVQKLLDTLEGRTVAGTHKTHSAEDMDSGRIHHPDLDNPKIMKNALKSYEAALDQRR